jgi:hypothetical protein
MQFNSLYNSQRTKTPRGEKTPKKNPLRKEEGKRETTEKTW